MPRVLAVLSLLLASAALAGPVNISPEEHERQARVLDQLTKAVAAETSDAAKLAIIARVMKEEKAVDLRGRPLSWRRRFRAPISTLSSLLCWAMNRTPASAVGRPRRWAI